MDQTDKIKKSLNQSIFIVLISNTIAGILFIFAFSLTQNISYLIAGISLIIIGIAYIFVVGYLRKRWKV